MTHEESPDRSDVSSARVPGLNLEAVGCLTFPLTIAAYFLVVAPWMGYPGNAAESPLGKLFALVWRWGLAGVLALAAVGLVVVVHRAWLATRRGH